MTIRILLSITIPDSVLDTTGSVTFSALCHVFRPSEGFVSCPRFCMITCGTLKAEDIIMIQE